MNTAQTEYKALSHVAKADRRFRVVQYAIALCFLVISLLLFNEIHNKNEQLIKKVDQALAEIIVQNEETRQYNTCLFLVPVEQRTPEKQRQCFREIDQPGGLDESNFQTSPATPIEGNGAPVTVVPNQDSSSYSNPTPIPETMQRELSQNSDPQQQSNQPEPQPQEPEQLNPIERVIETITNILGASNNG